MITSMASEIEHNPTQSRQARRPRQPCRETGWRGTLGPDLHIGTFAAL